MEILATDAHEYVGMEVHIGTLLRKDSRKSFIQSPTCEKVSDMYMRFAHNIYA